MSAPISPSASSFLRCWKLFTAFSVAGPKSPSGFSRPAMMRPPQGKPCRISSACAFHRADALPLKDGNIRDRIARYMRIDEVDPYVNIVDNGGCGFPAPIFFSPAVYWEVYPLKWTRYFCHFVIPIHVSEFCHFVSAMRNKFLFPL